MAKEIVSDKEGVVVKQLSSPRKNTVIDKNFRMTEYDDDVSSLNAGASEKKGLSRSASVEAAPSRSSERTLLGSHGPDAQGKIDWAKNQDSVDYLLQAHESSGNPNTEEGFAVTAAKCVNSFNKLFGKKDASGVHQPARMTASEIITGLQKYYVADSDGQGDVAEASPAGARSTAAKPVAESAIAPMKAPPKEELYYPLAKQSLDFSKGKRLLSGTHFEICKVLNCKQICMVQRTKGSIEQNGLFHAACGASEKNVIDVAQCPQEQELSEKEQFLFQMFLQQFNGDALQAKKVFFLSRSIQSK